MTDDDERNDESTLQSTIQLNQQRQRGFEDHRLKAPCLKYYNENLININYFHSF
jgi:hypothetical protein